MGKYCHSKCPPCTHQENFAKVKYPGWNEIFCLISSAFQPPKWVPCCLFVCLFVIFWGFFVEVIEVGNDWPKKLTRITQDDTRIELIHLIAIRTPSIHTIYMVEQLLIGLWRMYAFAQSVCFYEMMSQNFRAMNQDATPIKLIHLFI